MDPEKTPKVSVVVPLFNEVESIPALRARLTDAVTGLGVPAEIIVVDDGSQDGSGEQLEEWSRADPRVGIVRFRRNFGQTAAFSAGFDRARGEIIVTIDADLQNDPADIGRLLAKVDEGFDVVSGWRVRRRDPFWTRRLPSMLANRLIAWATRVRLHDYGCSLKAYRREVVKGIKLYGELHRFIPAIASWMGVTVAELPVNHEARRFGTSKYGLSRTMRVLLDLMTVRFLLSYSTRPLHVFGPIGLGALLVGFVICSYLAAAKIFAGASLADRPLLTLGVLLLIVGVQLVFMGLLGELLVRTYHESQNKPIDVVRDSRN